MDYTEIGNNVIIQSGTVIGSDAFYYNTKKDRDVWYKKMQSCGNVIIEDDVEIGANCTIDRGVTASTRIGKEPRWITLSILVMIQMLAVIVCLPGRLVLQAPVLLKMV
jgi:serine acetyltransferase